MVPPSSYVKCIVHRFLDQELIPYVSLFILLFLEHPLQKKTEGPVVSNWIGVTFDRIILQVNEL